MLANLGENVILLHIRNPPRPGRVALLSSHADVMQMMAEQSEEVPYYLH